MMSRRALQTMGARLAPERKRQDYGTILTRTRQLWRLLGSQTSTFLIELQNGFGLARPSIFGETVRTWITTTWPRTLALALHIPEDIGRGERASYS
jgi:hypothetical protein